jgi:hypothetical protein
MFFLWAVQNGNSSQLMNLTRRSYVETRESSVVVVLDLSGDWSLNVPEGWETPNSDIADLNDRRIGNSQLQTWLSVAQRTCTDTTGNPLVPISRAEKLGMVSAKRSEDDATATAPDHPVSETFRRARSFRRSHWTWTRAC